MLEKMAKEARKASRKLALASEAQKNDMLVLAFNFVGDALRDVLDPRLKGVIH